ncbi:MAG TPA: bidirectional hydrogenase complex protein HoxE [Anaerolineae bacterium]|nr:bidirectional hydrogenase complex protein HoxE [Anaerolineae bacterium]
MLDSKIGNHPGGTRSSAASDQSHPSGDPRFALIDRTLKRFRFQQDALIEVLHTAQEAFVFLEEDLLIYVARQLKLPLSWVFGVATFYHFFSLEPQGEHNCIICMGTACYVKRAAEIVAALQSAYGIEAGQTTPDGKLSITAARCLGSCGLAPVLIVDGEVLARETPETSVAAVARALASGRPSNGHNGHQPKANESFEEEIDL